MNLKKNIFPLMLLMLFPYGLYAWGDGERLSDGSCKFDLETGYVDSSLHIKNNEALIIINGGDSRYGTISTIYNAITCEKVTSGDPVESNYLGLMERKGFEKIYLSSTMNSTMDKSFRNIINFSKNDDIKVNVKHIDSATSIELTNLLKSLSDKSASFNINISASAQKLLSNKRFNDEYLKRITSLEANTINYDYALKLNAILKNDSEVESSIFNKFFDLNVKSIKDIPQWVNGMTNFGKQSVIPSYYNQIMNLSDFGKNLNPNNFLASIEYKHILKNLKLKKIGKVEKEDKEYGIVLAYPNKDIRLTQKPTCTSTGTTSTSEFRCGFLLMNTCVGTYDKYNCKGDTSAIANIEQQLMGTVKVATLLNKGWTYEPMISRYTKSNSISPHEYCDYLSNNRDIYMCKRGKYCDYLSNNRDINMCKRGKYCDYLSNNRDINMCKGGRYCDYLSNNRDIYMCKGGKYCDYLSSNRDINMCKGMSR